MSYETRCFKICLKPGSIEKVRAWAETINRRKDEALATLRDESVILEIVFLDQTAERNFLIYLMKAESFEKAKEVIKQSVHAIDEYHQNFKLECWAGGVPLEKICRGKKF